MASTFTTNKRIEKPAHGDYNNDWDIPLNADMDDIDTAFGGIAVVSVTGLTSGTYTLALSQFQAPNIFFEGTISAGASLNFAIPSGVGGLWSVGNFTIGATNPISILSAGGGPSVIPIPRGNRVFVVCDGTFMSFAQTQGTSANPSAAVGLTAVNGTAITFMTSDSAPALNTGISPTWTGAHIFNGNVIMQGVQFMTLTNTLTGGGGSLINMLSGTIEAQTLPPGTADVRVATTTFVANSFAPLASPILSGVPQSTTAGIGTSNTQIATTQFVNPSSGSNGSGRWRLNPDSSMVQWGIAAGSPGAPGTFVPFPTNFPTACESVVIANYGSSTATISVYNDGGAHQIGTTGFWLINGISGNCTWMAAGH